MTQKLILPASHLTRRRLLGTGLAGATALAAPALIAGRASAEAYDGTPFDAGGETLRVAMWGGTFEEALRAHVIPEFEATFNTRVEYDSAFPWFPKIVAAGPGNAPYDLVNIDISDLLKTQAAGDFFVPIDEIRANVPNTADLWDFAFDTGLAVTWIFTELGYCYRTDALGDGGAAPEGFRALWEPRFVDKRANFTTSNGFFQAHFLLTCQEFGAGQDDLEAGYAAYRELGRQKITDFSSAMTQLLEQGEAGIGTHHDAEAFAAIAGGAPLGFARWTGFAPAADQSVAIASGNSPVRRRLAYAFLDQLAGAPFQGVMSEMLFTQGTNRNWVVPQVMADMGITNTAAGAAGRWRPDWNIWVGNETDIVETVNQIYAQ